MEKKKQEPRASAAVPAASSAHAMTLPSVPPAAAVSAAALDGSGGDDSEIVLSPELAALGIHPTRLRILQGDHGDEEDTEATSLHRPIPGMPLLL
jgi:hypothetical protein